MAKAGFWTKQPGFFLYTVYACLKALVKLPCLMILYALPHFRPVREWTFQQAFVRAITRLMFEYVSVVELSIAPSFEPGKEGERFVIIAPAPDDDDDVNGNGHGKQSLYQGVAAPSPPTRPVTIGGTWYPSALHADNQQARQPGSKLFLHFHGGAYVLFDCRDLYMAPGARLLLGAAPAGSAVFCPQYRLASAPHPSAAGSSGRFPAALQDAITAYAHVVRRLRWPPQDVVLSGDSAGGNLALALLRYLCEAEGEPNETASEEGEAAAVAIPGHGLPQPGGVLLWSPWTDLTVGPEALAAREDERLDLFPPRLIDWALRVFLPDRVDSGGQRADVREDPYISPVMKGIETKVPIWVQWGGRELIKKDIQRFAEVQKQTGSRLGTFEIPNAPHDMFMAAKGLGFVKETKDAAEHAIRFLSGEC